MTAIDNLLNSITELKLICDKNNVSLINSINKIYNTVNYIYCGRYYLFYHDNMSYGGINDLYEIYGDLNEAIESCSFICKTIENVYVYDNLLHRIVYRRES